jgi:hypothetical protein
MRISKKQNIRSYRKIITRLFGLTFVSVLVVLGYETVQKAINMDSAYFCDAERYADGKFKSNGSIFTTNCFQDTREYASGKASCRCEGDKRYGPTLLLNDLKSGDTIFVRLKVKSTKNAISKLVFSSDKKHYYQEVISIGGDTQWKMYSSYYIIPSGAGGAVWKIYPAMVEGDGPAYFDDFSVDFEGYKVEVVPNTNYPTMELQINELNFRRIISLVRRVSLSL